MQRLDLYIDGFRKNTNQKSTNAAFQARIINALGSAKEIVITRTVELPPAPPAPKPQPNLLDGRGVFTAWDAGAANGLKLDWVALQIDPEGNPFPYVGNARRLAWQARATPDAMLLARKINAIGYLGQAENPDEFLACMHISESITMPKYLVGKPDGWQGAIGQGSIKEAIDYATAHGWGLLIEWYWNDQNALANGPDSHGMKVDACLFGCFQGKEERRFLSQYRKIWKGAFAPYTAETLTADERKEMES